jgi:hypothetical protein
MSSAVAQSLDGALVASVAVSADEATPRARLLAVQVEVAANLAAPQLALVASELVAAASVVVSADAVAAVAASAAIEVVLADAVDLEAEAVVDVVTLVVVVEGLVTNPMATVLPTARQQVPVAHEAVASVAIEEVAADLEAIELEAVEDDTKIVVAVVEVASTEVPAVLTMNRSVAEIGIAIATVVDTVEAETTPGSAVTKATTTTIRDSAADTRLTRCWLGWFPLAERSVLVQGFVKRLPPFSSPHLHAFSPLRVRS